MKKGKLTVGFKNPEYPFTEFFSLLSSCGLSDSDIRTAMARHLNNAGESLLFGLQDIGVLLETVRQHAKGKEIEEVPSMGYFIALIANLIEALQGFVENLSFKEFPSHLKMIRELEDKNFQFAKNI